jgi:hypothetical protein
MQCIKCMLIMQQKYLIHNFQQFTWQLKKSSFQNDFMNTQMLVNLGLWSSGMGCCVSGKGFLAL